MPTTLMVVVDGETVPLTDCTWAHLKSCGCLVTVALPEQGDGILLATPEQFHKHTRPRKASREKDIRNGMTIELITMAQYDERFRHGWHCAEHRKES